MAEWYFSDNGKRSGPYSEEAMLDLAKTGTIGSDTLCWQTEYGADWKPYVQTELGATTRDEPPPLPVARIPNHWAWLLAATPLLSSATDAMGLTTSFVGHSIWNSLGNIIVLLLLPAILVGLDRDAVIGAGYLKAPSRWWWMFPPVYLWKRGTCLNRRCRGPFWAMISLMFIIAAIGGAVDEPQSIVALPPCAGEFAQSETKSLFDKMPTIKSSEIEQVRLDSPRETDVTDDVRSCAGIVLDSHDQKHRVTYRFERHDNQIYVHLHRID